MNKMLAFYLEISGPPHFENEGQKTIEKGRIGGMEK